MNNKLLYPFERNRYFAGKMLTSADFGAEQSYMNDKRRFVNSLLFGSGIVCGCNVYSLDDLSVFVESGCAIDSQGREIVIDTSIVRKLSAVSGFEQIEGNNLTLCLKYAEENVHPVYSVRNHKSDSEYEYNRIKEGYELFLMDTAMVGSGIELDTEFMTEGVIFKNEDYKLSIKMPACVCKGKFVKILAVAEKISDSNAAFNYTGSLQMPSFTDAEGNHEQKIDFSGINLLKGKSVTREFWVYVQNVDSVDTVLVCKSSMESSEGSAFSLKVMISDITPSDLVDREIGKVSLELYGLGDVADFIPLADITLVRTDSAYIIDNINERARKKYIEAPAFDARRRDYLSFFQEDNLPGAKAVAAIQNTGAVAPSLRDSDHGLKIATGTLEIPLGKKARVGDVFYSGEIMHGLGAGTVYVEIGKEFIEDEPVNGANVKSTVYGNSDLFKENLGKAPQTETAVKVLNDKGSFVAAAKILSDVDCMMLTFRWVAIKFMGTASKAAPAENGEWIEAETPTVVLDCRENYYFGVKFHNMEKSSISYEVTEENGGKITSDGIYTAPAKEGVYEIKITCTDMPAVNTYAYAVVKKK